MKNEIELRDYFAAKALQGIMSDNEMWLRECRSSVQEIVPITVAKKCYFMADCMMEIRDKTTK